MQEAQVQFPALHKLEMVAYAYNPNNWIQRQGLEVPGHIPLATQSSRSAVGHMRAYFKTQPLPSPQPPNALIIEAPLLFSSEALPGTGARFLLKMSQLGSLVSARAEKQAFCLSRLWAHLSRCE